MSTPNIRPTVQPHSECYGLEYPAWQGRAGDVRRCAHGKVQVRTEVGPNARCAGPGTDWWRTLNPVWDFFEYRAAVRALEP